ncbi:MAG TPA: hypothetical protein PKZ24_10315, partial [Nitrospirales bacterium]|nr:hypothetical protein [Nitrospirales bacterium]
RAWSNASLPFPSFQIHNWSYSLYWRRTRCWPFPLGTDHLPFVRDDDPIAEKSFHALFVKEKGVE